MRSLLAAITFIVTVLFVLVPFPSAAPSVSLPPVSLPGVPIKAVPTPIPTLVTGVVSKVAQQPPTSTPVPPTTAKHAATATTVPAPPNTATPVSDPSGSQATPTSAPQQTQVPTAGPTDPPTTAPTASVTAVGTPTDTPTPIATASPTPNGTSSATSIDGVPLCGVTQPDGSVYGPAHDPTRWHPLVERNPNGSILCTYGHEHGPDPHQVDSVFGALAQAVAGGQDIAYPWITSSTENSTSPSSLSHQPVDNRPILNGKHAFFKWELLTPAMLAAGGVQGCPPNQNAPYGFDTIRMQVHADANAGGDIRFHSFYVQAQECSQSDSSYHGQITIGGHFDYGILNGTHTDNSGHLHDVRIPLPGTDPCAPGSTLSNGTSCPYNADRRTHGASGPGPNGSSDPNASLPGYPRGDFTWYGHNVDPDLAGQPGLQLSVSDGVREQDWGPVDPNDPHGPVLFYGPGHDHGWGGIDIFDFVAPQPSAFPSNEPATVNSNGTYSWSGFVDEHGFVQSKSSCQSQGASTSCIPAELKDIRPGEAQFSNDTTNLPPQTFDVQGPSGASLIGYPN